MARFEFQNLFSQSLTIQKAIIDPFLGVAQSSQEILHRFPFLGQIL